MLLKDGETVNIDGESFAVSQKMVRVAKNDPMKGVKQMAATAVVAALVVWSRKARMVAAGIGATLASYFALMSFKPVSQFASSIFLPVVMKGMDAATKDVKAELLTRSIKGDVMDFGCADGQYLQYIAKSKDRVDKVVSLEPNAFHHESIMKRAEKLGLADKTSVFGGFAKDLLDKDGPNLFDCIIVGNVLCEVPDQRVVLAELHELLKPGGKMFFIEHVAGEDGSWMKTVQDAVNPLWVHMSDGCNCNRKTLKSIEQQPWDVYAWEINTFFPLFGRLFTGIAVKRTNDVQELHHQGRL